MFNFVDFEGAVVRMAGEVRRDPDTSWRATVGERWTAFQIAVLDKMRDREVFNTRMDDPRIVAHARQQIEAIDEAKAVLARDGAPLPDEALCEATLRLLASR